ncbi:MAG: methylmalonyl Co-A mutase-associated GTPase MeaB [Acidimicrobiales bacterium]
MPSPTPASLLDAARGGDRAALGRVLSLVERGGDAAREIGSLLSGHVERLSADPAPDGTATPAYVVGITGAPGGGKSTLTSAVVTLVRAHDEPVAVLAVDPSSPFTGGALLGDRVRMGEHALDDGVFIRSMATRGHLGGLAVAAPEAVRVLGAAGFDWVLVETVGVGQVEVEVAGQADTTVVVVNPGWGDAVQAAKAGLMEIADVFVVNKADRPGADEARRDLERLLDMSGTGNGWRPPVLSAVATTGEGVGEVWAAVGRHRTEQEASGGLASRRRRRATEEITRLVAVRLMEQARTTTAGERAAALADEVATGTLDPWSAAEQLLDD